MTSGKSAYAKFIDNLMLDNYKSIAVDLLKLNFPLLSQDEISMAVDWSISKNLKDTPIKIDNNYKHRNIDSTLLDMSNYILSREPIITPYGVMFKRHGEVPNPIYNLVDNFIKIRKLQKKEMFKYPKGSEMFEKYNLLQALSKIN